MYVSTGGTTQSSLCSPSGSEPLVNIDIYVHFPNTRPCTVSYLGALGCSKLSRTAFSTMIRASLSADARRSCPQVRAKASSSRNRLRARATSGFRTFDCSIKATPPVSVNRTGGRETDGLEETKPLVGGKGAGPPSCGQMTGSRRRAAQSASPPGQKHSLRSVAWHSGRIYPSVFCTVVRGSSKLEDVVSHRARPSRWPFRNRTNPCYFVA